MEFIKFIGEFYKKIFVNLFIVSIECMKISYSEYGTRGYHRIIKFTDLRTGKEFARYKFITTKKKQIHFLYLAFFLFMI